MSEEMIIEALLRKVHSEGLPRYPLLVVFFTGSEEPPDCVSMLRVPMLSGGFVFGEDFGSRVRQAMADNESAHDGAVAFGRSRKSSSYKCAGWSYRIVATTASGAAEANRGAAYNSAISLSLSRGVDLVCLFSRDLEIFVGGRRATLVEGR
ncbi:hypothetical protein [Bradyrhizobium sp. B117]|uniref:hypothetical protein n=1 Tax=Bradyrhizobium sp. B117 TaxID=3140246 RepID=UPI00318325B0